MTTMPLRRSLSAMLLLAGISAVFGCGNPSGLDSIQVSPSSQALTVGQTAQFTATGTYGNANHPSTQNITGAVTWSSTAPSVATVTSGGLVTAVGAGTTTITASATAFNGPISSSGTITVASTGGGGTASGAVVGLAVIPGSQTVSAPGQTAQFIAIGTTSSGATVNLTSQVAWSTSSTAIATIGSSTGLATAVGSGTATITAIYSASGTVVTGTAAFSVSGGTTEKYTGVSITPGSQSLSSSGQTGQFVALGTFGANGLMTDVTSSPQIKWLSSSPTVATVSATGLATGVSPGTTTITAELVNPDNTVVSSNATIAVNNTPAPEPLLSLQIIPSSITVGNLQDSAQFLAIGTFSSAPYVRDLTNSSTLTWISATPSVFPVNSNTGGGSTATAGIVTAYGVGTGTIIAEAKGSDGSIQTATATFTCPAPDSPPKPGQCYQGSQADALLSTITVYNEGLNTSNWLVTAPSATGTSNVLHCGPGWTADGNPGGSVCAATYGVTATQGVTIMLTAPAQTGVAFGGWSYNCTPTNSAGVPIPAPGPYYTAAGPNYCTVTLSPPTATEPLNSNVTVGAIFN